LRNYLVTFAQLSGDIRAIIWRYSRNYLAIFAQLSGDIRAIIWRYSRNYLHAYKKGKSSALFPFYGFPPRKTPMPS